MRPPSQAHPQAPPQAHPQAHPQAPPLTSYWGVRGVSPLEDISRYPHIVFFLDFITQGVKFNCKIEREVLKIH